MASPFNPLNWLTSAQDWFAKTEKSSGFRPFLIFLLIHVGFVIILLAAFGQNKVTSIFVVPSLFISFIGFVLLYVVKAFHDPNFCRSERHIETVKHIEMEEQKGDPGPKPVDVTASAIIEEKQLRELPRHSQSAEP